MRKSDYRPDIDGLRAIAITSVVLYHTANWLAPSGFVGVDIFFVISGYLIGGITYVDIRRGDFSFANFYARRARRILPAVMALLSVCCVFGYFFASGPEYQEFGIETIGTLFGVSNVKFWLKNGYFAEAAPIVLLLMTWSLGVEEQFYAVFPFILKAIDRLSARRKFLILGILAALSFVGSVVITPLVPFAAFYLLPTRMWELGAGALLAILLAERSRKPDPVPFWLGQLIGIVGLVMLIASIFVLGNTPFPGYAALLPVLATVMLIYAKVSITNRMILRSRLFVGIGLISYSWYLWHWPLLSMAHIVCDYTPKPEVLLTISGIGLVLAYCSYRWVEQPFRLHPWSTKTTLWRFGLALGAFAVLQGVIIVTIGLPGRLPEPVRVADQLRRMGAGDCQISFGSTALREDERCMPKSGPAKILAVIGDSHANALGFGLADVAAKMGYRFWQVEKSACMPLLGVATADPSRPFHASQCATFVDRAVERLANEPAVDTVIIAAAWPADNDPRLEVIDTDGGSAKLDARRGMRLGLPPLIDRLEAAGKHVVLVGDVPHFEPFDPMRHAINVGIPARHFLKQLLEPDLYTNGLFPLSGLEARFDNVTDYVRNLAKEKHTGYIDIADQLCSDDGCRFEIDNIPFFVDDTHLSAFGSRLLNWDVLAQVTHVAAVAH